MANPVHPLHPAGILEVHLREADDRGDTEEVHDRQQDEREGDEAGAEVGCLGDEREGDDRAGEGGDEDRRAAHRLRVDEAARGEQAPVLRRQDLERLRAELSAS